MGQNHLRVLASLRNVELCGIYDQDSEILSFSAQRYGVYACASLDELVDRCDAIVLVTPTSVHFEQIKSLIPRVRFLFVEKPLVPTVVQSAEIMELARIHGAKIQVGFIERFNPAVSVLKGVFSRLDQPIQADFSRMNKFSARIRDVDVVTDLMIHDLDLALYLFGPCLRVQAYGFKDSEQSVAWARAQIWHESGVVSQVTASRMTDRRIRQITATCADGFVDANLLRREVEIHRQYIENYADDITVSASVESVDVKPQESLLLELGAFISACETGDFSRVPSAQDSLSAIDLCEQILIQIRMPQ